MKLAAVGFFFASTAAMAQVIGLGTTQVGATFQLATGVAKVVSDKGGVQMRTQRTRQLLVGQQRRGQADDECVLALHRLAQAAEDGGHRTRSVSTSARTKSKSVWLAEGKPTSISL